MNCKAAKKLIPAFMDGELDLQSSEALSQHVASCQACREEMAALKRTAEAMATYVEIEPSFTLADIRERAVRQEARSLMPARLWSMPRFVTAAMVLAALATGGVSGVYYGSHVGGRAKSPPVVSAQHASKSFGLDAFDNGLAGAMYVADAKTPSSEVTR